MQCVVLIPQSGLVFYKFSHGDSKEKQLYCIKCAVLYIIKCGAGVETTCHLPLKQRTRSVCNPYVSSVILSILSKPTL